MIVKFNRPGQSFKGLVTYLTHDAGHAETAERLAWTHSLNLAHDHVESCVHEMLMTTLDAELLKEAAGRSGGGSVEKPVKHVSLNWHPSETPDKAAMIEAAAGFLAHMGWGEHQALLVAHTDKAHPHVHLVINAVHPETGLKLDDGFEKRRAQVWALGYEAAHGKIFCEERLKTIPERETSMPRPAWLAMRDAVEQELGRERAQEPFDPSYLFRDENRLIIERNEWALLKELQKEERLGFFEAGRTIYGDIHRAVYREVRAEMREDWSAYYAAKRDGLAPDLLADIRAGLIAQQDALIAERRELATAPVREARDEAYRVLLDLQKDERRDLIERQEQGLRSPHLLDRAYGAEPVAPAQQDGIAPDAALDRFGVRRGRDGSEPSQERGWERNEPAPSIEEALGARGWEPAPKAPSRDLASGLVGGVLAILGGVSDSFTGGHVRPPPKPAEQDPLARFGITRGQYPDQAADKTRREREEAESWDAYLRKRELDRSRSI